MAGMGAEGFEPPKAMPFDLQSNLVVHLSTLPKLVRKDSNLQPTN